MHPTIADPYTLPRTKDAFETFLQRNNIEKRFAPVIRTILRTRYLTNNNNRLIRKWLIQTMQYYFETGNLPTKPRKKILRYYKDQPSTIKKIIKQLKDQTSRCDEPPEPQTPSFESLGTGNKERSVTLGA
jgi:hypothetical protein